MRLELGTNAVLRSRRGAVPVATGIVIRSGDLRLRKTEKSADSTVCCEATGFIDGAGRVARKIAPQSFATPVQGFLYNERPFSGLALSEKIRLVLGCPVLQATGNYSSSPGGLLQELPPPH